MSKQKPVYKEVKQMVQAVLKVDAQLVKFGEEEPLRKLAVRQAAERVWQESIRKTLESMDIEELNRQKLGLRLSVLREAGIENIWQVSQMSLVQLTDLDGIGEQSAKKIREISTAIYQSVQKTTGIRLSPDNRTPAADDLIQKLYVYGKAKELEKESRKLIDSFHSEIHRRAPSAKKAGGRFSWFFSSSAQKNQAMEDAAYFEELFTGTYYTQGQQFWQQYQKYQTASVQEGWQDFSKNAPAYYAALEEIDKDRFQKGREPDDIPESLAEKIRQTPLDLQALRCTLRQYQRFGVQYIVCQENVLLGDEMGLGKTIQAIGAMAALSAAGGTHFMVVCPASVLINWCREIEKHSTLQVTKIHGGDEEACYNWRIHGGVAVTTYESISRFTVPEKFRISMLIADEAHYVKNPSAIRTKALLSLRKRAERVLFMTGTPLENRVDEMCFLVNCLQPDIAKQLEGMKFLSAAPQFRQTLAPVYLRRTREDVLQELPELVEKEDWCPLEDREKKAYRQAVFARNFMEMRQVSWQVEEPEKNSSKAKRLLEICQLAKEENRKIIVFSFFLHTLQTVAGLLGDRCMEVITGAVPPARRQEILDEFDRAESGAVLVCQIQAGGTGLNIQAASVVVFCEPQWKPSIENQAISRAYRMGQVRSVLVRRLLCEDCVDEQMVELLKQKQALFDQFADESVIGEESLQGEGQQVITHLIDEEIARLQKQDATGDKTHGEGAGQAGQET